MVTSRSFPPNLDGSRGPSSYETKVVGYGRNVITSESCGCPIQGSLCCSTLGAGVRVDHGRGETRTDGHVSRGENGPGTSYLLSSFWKTVGTFSSSGEMYRGPQP